MADSDDPFEKTRMTLGEHLEELRRRLMIGLGAVLACFIVAWIWSDVAARVVLRPYYFTVEKLEEYYTAKAEEALAADPTIPREELFERIGDHERVRALGDTRMTVVAPGEGFLFELKVCGYFALLAGSPILLWQVWMFVAAGLYPREKRVVLWFFPAAFGLFAAGIVFGYFLLVPYGMYFLNRATDIRLMRMDLRVQEYFSFLSGLCLALGLVFQLPILMVVLARLDIVRWRTMARYRGHMLIGATVVGGILTPPDPYTQIMLAVPIIVLYEAGIWCARFSSPKEQPA